MSTVHLRLLIAVVVSFITLFIVVAVQAKPVWYPETTLYASDGKRLDAFGYAVAIEQDTLVVTAGSGTYVFEHSGSTWVEQAKLLPNDIEEAGANFGRSVAISGDTIAVSAPTAETNIDPPYINKTGAVYIFTRQGVTWKQQAKLFPPKSETGLHFGYDVAIDQNTLVVGQSRKAHVFERDSVTATWSYTATLTIPSNAERKTAAPSSYLSETVAISGNTILVAGSNTPPEGAVAILFERQSQPGTWRYAQELLFPIPPKILGGTRSVALDRNTLLLGVPLEASFPFVGSAYIAQRPTADIEWRQMAKLAPRNIQRPGGFGLLADYGFGDQVALKGDYAIVTAVGAQNNVLVRNSEGEVFLFHRQPRSHYWSQLAKLSRHSTKQEFLPTISLSNRYVVVGDKTALNAQGELTGAVHIFALPTVPH